MSGRYGSSGSNWKTDFMIWLEKYYPHLYAYFYNDEDDEEDVLTEEEEEEEVEPSREELFVETVDLHIAENTKQHHTDKYRCTQKSKDPQLVVRRGQEIKMTITFNQAYNVKDDDLEIDFKIGSSPKENASEPGKGSLIEMKLDESGTRSSDVYKWHARLVRRFGNSIEVEITSSANCLIGEWEYNVYTKRRGENTRTLRYTPTVDIMMVFNPWCKHDLVYFEKDSLDDSATCDPRDEYILNATGVVYRGNSTRIKGKNWRFGQFDIEILRICWKMLLRNARGRAISDFSDPILVSRMISRLVNSADDHGILQGKWGGGYDDGTSPTAWNGSGPILTQWDETNRAVKYGQCWVFSGVVTTVCRALGIPCRSITNFSSAHDTDRSATIDKYIGKQGADSIWNFHVWNEVWLCRPDIPNHDGWQIIDATPQELSDGVYRCGPCPLKAVKQGQISLPHDTGFVFAEVNADRITWQKLNGKWKNIYTETDIVGKCISTKPCTGKPYNGKSGRRIRSYEKHLRYDVTHLYKFRRGSEEERLAVHNATQTSRRRFYSDVDKHKELILTIKEPEVTVGESFKVELLVKCNAADGEITLDKLNLFLSSRMYSGNNKRKIKSYRSRSLIRMRKGEEKAITMEVSPEDYVDKLSEQLDFYAFAIARNQASREVCVGECQFEMDNIELDIEAPATCRNGEKFTVKMSFTNPLPKPLRNCELLIETDHFDDVRKMKIHEVKPKSKWSTSFEMRANTTGEGEMSAVVDSSQLADIEGSCIINVL